MNIEEHIRAWRHSSIRVLDTRRILMNKGDSLASYRFPANGFLAMLRGSALLLIDGNEQHAGPFHVLHSAKGMYLDIPPLKDSIEYQLIFYKPVYTLADPKGIKRILERNNPFHVQYGLKPSHPALIRNLLMNMIQEWESTGSLQKFHVKSLFLQLVYEILQQLQSQGTLSLRTDLVTQAIRYMDEYYSQPITVDSLAKALNCSPRHLSRLFQKSQIGQTPSDYLIQVRMGHASELLRYTQLTLQEIATDTGYQDGYYFSRMFKKYSGLSPLAYRNRANPRHLGPDMTSTMSEYPIAALQHHDYIDNKNQYQSGGKIAINSSYAVRSKMMMLLISTTLLLGACSSNANLASTSNSSAAPGETTGQALSDNVASGNTRSIPHDLGHTEVPDAPERVVVLEQGFTQTVAALEVKPVGVADDNKPERFPQDTLAYIEGYTSVGTRSEPNLEIIRTLKPDLIIADSSRHSQIYEQLSDIAPTLIYKNDKADYAQTLAATQAIGEALGKTEEIKTLIAEHQAQVEKLKQEINTDQSVLILQPEEASSNSFEVRTDSAFHSSFLKTLGLDYALSGDSGASQLMTIEQVLAIDPDNILILINEDAESVIEAQKDNPLWAQLKSVQGGKVHEVALATWSRQRSIPALAQVMDETADLF